MASPTIIAVTGASGAQGGSLVRAIVAERSGAFRARAITRNPESDKSKALRAAGVEVVAADLDDTASLTRAFQGAGGAFCVTSFWEHMSAAKELQQARNLAAAAKASGVGHVVWSSLEDTRKFIPLSDTRMPTLQGTYKVPHFDAKAEAEAFFADAGVPTTNLHTTFYWENLIYFGVGPKRQPDGTYAFTLPMGDKKLVGISSEDIGKCALGVFRRGAEFRGRTVGIAGEHITCAAMAEAMARATGKTIRYNEVSPDAFRAFGFPGADESGNMFQFYRDFEESFCASRSVELARSLNPELQSFAVWLAANAQRIPLD